MTWICDFLVDYSRASVPALRLVPEVTWRDWAASRGRGLTPAAASLARPPVHPRMPASTAHPPVHPCQPTHLRSYLSTHSLTGLGRSHPIPSHGLNPQEQKLDIMMGQEIVAQRVRTGLAVTSGERCGWSWSQVRDCLASRVSGTFPPPHLLWCNPPGHHLEMVRRCQSHVWAGYMLSCSCCPHLLVTARLKLGAGEGSPLGGQDLGSVEL